MTQNSDRKVIFGKKMSDKKMSFGKLSTFGKLSIILDPSVSTPCECRAWKPTDPIGLQENSDEDCGNRRDPKWLGPNISQNG